jgi:protein-L-isoaspartate(D-aspartate) O-methyltransferase
MVADRLGATVRALFPALIFLACSSLGQDSPPEKYDQLRDRMVTVQLEARDISDDRVLAAMRSVPRHLFVPPDVRDLAYQDSPLPIGLDQTISQPYIVALMTQLARPGPDDRALEVGTGSGYQAAVLSRIVDRVFTIEIIEDLAERARNVISGLGYENVRFRVGDGYDGWPEMGPFDLILVTAAAPRVPQPLIDQLAEGGRLVIPVGGTWEIQQLKLYRKQQGKLKVAEVLPVRFVPMTGKVRDPGE